ncbi:MAG: response regulator [Colwellia sp.]|nr:response regulator [Colwellia sp.]
MCSIPKLTKNSNIIVLDDEVDIIDFAEIILTDLGFEKISSFTSIKDFTESNVIYNADLIFIDVNLKDINGLILLAWVKAKRPSAAVIMFSGDTRLELIKEAKQLGAISFLSKLALDKNVRELFNKWHVNYPLV